jgi:uncharacterized membrane protein YedE/YeeE
VSLATSAPQVAAAETQRLEPGAIEGVSAEVPAEVRVAAVPAAAADATAGARGDGSGTPDAASGDTSRTQAPYGRTVNGLADRLDDSRFFSSLFDFTFTSYVTRKLAGPVYVVGLVLIGLGIVVGFANSLGIAIATRSPGGGAFVFLLGVLVTLVAAILSVLLLRVTIEVFCAIIEIAQNTRRRRPPRD